MDIVIGTAGFCRRTAVAELTGTGQYRWVGETAPGNFESVSARGARHWLGTECDALVFDSHTGFDPDTLGAAAGTVRAGGRLLLLVPPLARWPDHPDPVNDRVAVHGSAITRSRYLARCAALLPGLATRTVLESGSTAPARPPQLPWAPPTAPTADQQRLVADIVTAFASPHAVAAVVRADRGRGKSAALGLLAARLADGGFTVFVTAPNRRASAVLFQHAAEHWPASAATSAPTFLAPDRAAVDAENGVLLVDEAGGLHLGLTGKILQHWNNVVFAGTVHGYEGAGRGFETRFRQLLDSRPHRARFLTLEQPLRWPPGDPLEAATNALLMLDATTSAQQGPVNCRWVDRDSLARDEAYLRAVYALLSEAHYRTRPLDLRHLLDGPNLRLAVADCNGQPVAAAMVAAEGPFDDTELVAAVASGTRRPRGHLMPQLLTWRYGLTAACSHRWWRIVRIAVHTSCRRRGRGAGLLDWLQQHARAEQVDGLCASFGADPEVVSFWQAQHYRAVYLGHVREATSGAFSVAVIRSLTPRNAALAAQAVRAFSVALADRTELDPALETRLQPTESPP